MTTPAISSDQEILCREYSWLYVCEDFSATWESAGEYLWEQRENINIIFKYLKLPLSANIYLIQGVYYERCPLWLWLYYIKHYLRMCPNIILLNAFIFF